MKTSSLLQTIGACVVSLIAFFILLYVGGALLDWAWRQFDTKEPGLITLSVRAIITSALSAIGAFSLCGLLFPDGSSKVVPIAFGVGLICWATAMSLLIPFGDVPLDVALIAGVLPIALAIGPGLVVAAWVYRDAQALDDR